MGLLRTIADPFGLAPRALRAGERAGRTAADLAGRATVAALHRVLASSYASEAVEIAAGSPAAERAVCALTDRVLADGVADQVAQRVLDGPELERLVTSVVESPAVARLVAQTMADPATAELIERALNSAETEQLVARALDTEGMERLVAQVLDSRLVDVSVARVLASDELWLVVEEIARSPAVTEAISHQSAGFADQLAGDVAQRSRRADAWLERVAHRMLHRPAPDPAGGTLA